MLSKELMIELFKELNVRLEREGIRGELFVVGDAAMSLSYNARESTKDVDAIMYSSSTIRSIAEDIANDRGLESGWLNDGVKGFLENVPEAQVEIISFPNLRVYSPPPDYIFAMKAIAARFDSRDGEDAKFLMNLLGINNVDEALKTVEKYFPKNRISAKVTFFLEELLENH